MAGARKNRSPKAPEPEPERIYLGHVAGTIAGEHRGAWRRDSLGGRKVTEDDLWDALWSGRFNDGDEPGGTCLTMDMSGGSQAEFPVTLEQLAGVLGGRNCVTDPETGKGLPSKIPEHPGLASQLPDGPPLWMKLSTIPVSCVERYYLETIFLRLKIPADRLAVWATCRPWAGDTEGRRIRSVIRSAHRRLARGCKRSYRALAKDLEKYGDHESFAESTLRMILARDYDPQGDRKIPGIDDHNNLAEFLEWERSEGLYEYPEART